MRLCFVGDARSIHTRRWVRWFARDHEAHLIRTAPTELMPEIPGITLPLHGLVPGTRLLATLRAVRSYVSATAPDVLHGHFINEAGWFTALSGHPATVVSAWGSDIYRAPRESRLAALLNPWSVRRVDLVTCDSDDQAKVLRAWGARADRVQVVGWGVDLDAFSPGVDGGAFRDRLGIPREAGVLFSPRQWLPNSQIHVILDAFDHLPATTHLVLMRLPAFEGEYGRQISERVAALAGSGRVHVVADVGEDELPLVYAASDCIVSLCETDGTPLSVLEGMATGLPVVAFLNPSLSEWVAPEGGALVARADGQDVADAVLPFLDRAGRRWREAASFNRQVVSRRADRRKELGAMDAHYRRLAVKD